MTARTPRLLGHDLPRSRGFTLIEVLVSLIILSVMAATAFKGMDAISRAREVAEGKLKRTLRLQSVMTQWDVDMASVIDVPTVNMGTNTQGSFEIDGASVRFTRQDGGGVRVVMWGLRDNKWIRWAGPVTTLVGDLDKQWALSRQLQGSEPGVLVALRGVDQWQAYRCVPRGAPGQGARGCDVTNGQSSSTGAPMGIRSVLTLSAGSGFEGAITRDVMLAPH
jgi:general secretion pathway protein J